MEELQRPSNWNPRYWKPTEWTGVLGFLIALTLAMTTLYSVVTRSIVRVRIGTPEWRQLSERELQTYSGRANELRSVSQSPLETLLPLVVSTTIYNAGAPVQIDGVFLEVALSSPWPEGFATWSGPSSATPYDVLRVGNDEHPDRWALRLRFKEVVPQPNPAYLTVYSYSLMHKGEARHFACCIPEDVLIGRAVVRSSDEAPGAHAGEDGFVWSFWDSARPSAKIVVMLGGRSEVVDDVTEELQGLLSLLKLRATDDNIPAIVSPPRDE